jgi:prepilin-type N-terminal cleavage/methylation domain-containing protein
MNDERCTMNRTPSPTLPPRGLRLGRASGSERGGRGWGGLHTFNSKGFTLIEMIAIMIIVGILAVVLMPRIDFTLSTTASVTGAVYMIASDIRYAQECAMANRVSKSITFTASQNFYTFPATIPSTSNLDPSGRLPSGVTTLDNLTITFNSLGEPTSIAAVNPYYVDIRVSAGGSPRTIRIWCFTGKVVIL